MRTRFKLRFQYAIAVLVSAGIIFSFLNICSAASEEFMYNAKDRRDPFIPLIGEGVNVKSDKPSISIDSLKLEGVVVDPKQGSFIMVDGEVYGVGELVGPYKVEKIEENRVVLKYNKERYELKLEEDIAAS